MGFFSNLFGQAKELTKIGNAVANIKIMLDNYEEDEDTTYLYVSAWICKVGILDMIEKNHWPPNYTAFVPINGHQTRMTMMEMQIATLGRLANKVKNTGNTLLENKINDILDGGPTFYEIEAQLPQNIKDTIENPL